MDKIFTHITNINKITTIFGYDRTEQNYFNADRMFLNSPVVQHIAYLHGNYSTPTCLKKNDLNGHFLTDQPGQPFNEDIREHAGIGDLKNDDYNPPRSEKRKFCLYFKAQMKNIK